MGHAEQPSALVCTVSEADAVVGPLRLQHDPSASEGMPAHVTVLSPFVSRARWGPSYDVRMKALARSLEAFDARFNRIGRFGTTTVFLVPEPAEAFARLDRAVTAAFPEHPPYEGKFVRTVPHLTVAHGVSASALNAVASQLEGRTDIRSRMSDLRLFFPESDGRWRERARFPFGSP